MGWGPRQGNICISQKQGIGTLLHISGRLNTYRMEITEPELLHLQKYFNKYAINLVRCPQVVKGMYYFTDSAILYDPKFIYLGPEVQYFIVMHAILTQKTF